MNKRKFVKLQKEILSAMEDGHRENIIATIQASTPEGNKDDIILENLLTGRTLSSSIAGITNEYKTYSSQVAATYRKYNNRDDWGNSQVRAIVDIRTSFEASEGLNVSCEDERSANWINSFIRDNKLDGSFLLNVIKTGEMAGRCLIYLTVEKNGTDNPKIKVHKHGYNGDSLGYKIKDGKVHLYKEIDENGRKEKEEQTITKNFYNVVVGGDPSLMNGATTKVGTVLNDCENYDRAIKDMRRLNHVLARITPTVKTESERVAAQVRSVMNKIRWKIGQAFISSGEFDYKVPDTGAHENLKTEAIANIKNISAVTGIPVHWIGWVDLMSNRSTAETLYETIKNSTTYERMVWSETFRDIIIKAQELYIDNGGNEISYVNKDVEVRIPIIDFSQFLEKVRGWSIAFNDGAVSLDDYMNNIPGINPLSTRKALKAQEEEEIKALVKRTEKPIPEGE